MDDLKEFCRRNHIRRLSLFGSAARDDFTPDSDVDLLVEFEPGRTPGLAFFRIQDKVREIEIKGLLDEKGQPFDGNGDGIAGGSFVERYEFIEARENEDLIFSDPDGDEITLKVAAAEAIDLLRSLDRGFHEVWIVNPVPFKCVTFASLRKSPLGNGRTIIQEIIGLDTKEGSTLFVDPRFGLQGAQF